VRKSWSVPATPTSVGELRRAVVDFASESGVGDPPLSSVRHAVSEAVTNVVVHGYRERPTPGHVEVDAEIRKDELHVTVRDSGLGFQPRVDSPGAGLGLPIIAQVTDSFEFRNRQPSGTELHLCFKL
jgi:serine/threonine-protein kinase RsbW